MARTCLNCGTAITCGCQDRKAKDGKACCSRCVDAYNAKLNIRPNSTLENVVQSVSSNTIPEIKSIDIKFNNFNN